MLLNPVAAGVQATDHVLQEALWATAGQADGHVPRGQNQTPRPEHQARFHEGSIGFYAGFRVVVPLLRNLTEVAIIRRVTACC